MIQINENSQLEYQLIQIVKDFAIKMNEIENYIFESVKSNPRSDIDIFIEYKKLFNPVFKNYVTSKKRVIGGHANSYGRPTKYDGIVNETLGQVTLTSNCKAEIYFKTESNFKAEYLFTLYIEEDNWKIDNVKYKWFNKEKWKPLIM